VALINYKSSQIRLNYPNKVLPVSVTSVSGKSYWPHANGSDDPWYASASTPKNYRWTIVFDVTAQTHGSHLTRDDKTYNGLDIVVGDWIASATTGVCLKVISIESKTITSVTAVVEDWLRYNTFASATGNGIFGLGSAAVFSLNENGIPMLDPLPTTVSSSFYPTVMSRFQYMNPQTNYVLEQTAHGFNKGDVISVSTTGFYKSNSATVSKSIGIVTEPGPGPDQFMIMPNNRIIDFEPTIPGTQGQFVYVTDAGGLSTTESDAAKFLVLQPAIPTVLKGIGNDPTVPDTHVMKLNSHAITFAGTGGNPVTTSQIVSQINADTSTHKVTASVTPTKTVINSDASATAYGLVGGYVPFSANIDSGNGNTTVSFTTDSAGQAQYGIAVGIPQDMATDINAANIPNLTATFNAGTLTLTEDNGNTVNIYSVSADANGNPFVGLNHTSGLPEVTSATGTEQVTLTRSDGGEILIYEATEHFRNNVGMSSGHTGMYPLALNVEQGIRGGTVKVVANIAARNALAAQVGDQAHVLAAGDGEWALYLYDGSGWVKISDMDSSTTDARTYTTTFTMPVGGFGVSSTNTLGNISAGAKITTVSVDVDTAFTGYSGAITPNIEVGTTSDPDLVCDSPSNDLTETNGRFMCFPEYTHPESSANDLTIKARCWHYGSTAGAVTVKISYI
jgi:hypothetical protein